MAQKGAERSSRPLKNDLDGVDIHVLPLPLLALGGGLMTPHASSVTVVGTVSLSSLVSRLEACSLDVCRKVGVRTVCIVCSTRQPVSLGR